MAFTLAILPVVYRAIYNGHEWCEEFIEQEHLSANQEANLPQNERDVLNQKRNNFSDAPLVNFTTQYGLGCFEGLKAYPRPQGTLSLFRPEENGRRFAASMAGIRMPVFPEKHFVAACQETIARNVKLGFTLSYNKNWEKDNFANAEALYVRPFSYAEGGIGVSLSQFPSVYIIITPVSAYFKPGRPTAVTTKRIRAMRYGTGSIKCTSNYVISALARKEAEDAGYMEAVFLDGQQQKFVEEGSSCNIFFYLKSGVLVTPALGDTILPGITRKSILELAKDIGIKTEERKISIDEAMDSSQEVFFTGTAAGASFVESLTHQDKTVFFGEEPGPLTKKLAYTLKGIQYGLLQSKTSWMLPIAL